MKIITNGRIITDGRIIDGFDIITDGKKILSIVKSESVSGNKTDLAGKFIAPGFIDLHCHGGGGSEFIDGKPESFEIAAQVHFNHGTRVMYPAISATDGETVVRVLECARRVKDKWKSMKR